MKTTASQLRKQLSAQKSSEEEAIENIDEIIEDLTRQTDMKIAQMRAAQEQHHAVLEVLERALNKQQPKNWLGR